MSPNFLLAGTVAAGIAWVCNRYLYARFGSPVVGSVVPMTEEVLKTGLATLCHASLVGTHGVFGVVEFVWDFANPGSGRWLPAMTGLLSHLLYGLLTDRISALTGSLGLAVLVAALVHMAWNRFVMRLDH